MRVVFISGVELGRYALQGIMDSVSWKRRELDIKAIIGLSETKAPHTSGFCKFDDLALKAGADLYYIESIKNDNVIQMLRIYEPDFIFIIGWSELAPSSLLDIPKQKVGSKDRHGPTHGCIGMHPTLLPQGRGRAPIPWAIIKGLTKSGVTLFYLEEEADAGDIILQKEFEITLRDDASTVYMKVARLHYTIMKEAIPLLISGKAPRIPQDESKATYWPRRRPEDGVIDWSKKKVDVYNWIRALTHPYPGAFTFLDRKRVVVWKADFGHIPKSNTLSRAKPGTIVDINAQGIYVMCHDAPLLLKRIQLEGREEMDSYMFASKFDLRVGMYFG